MLKNAKILHPIIAVYAWLLSCIFCSTVFSKDASYQHPQVGLSVVLRDGKELCFFCTQTPSFDNGLVRRTNKKKQRLIVTYPIRDNIEWSDGRKLQASDFLAGWRKARSNPLIRNKLPYNAIYNIKVNNKENKVVVSYKRLAFNYMHLTDIVPLYSHPTTEIITGLSETMDGYYQKQPVTFIEWLGFNLRNPSLQDVRVRQAISLALPWQDLQNISSSHKIIKTNKPFMDGNSEKTHQETPDTLQPDKLQEALRLLKEAGWQKTNRWQYKKSKRFEMQLYYLSQPAWRGRIAQRIKAALKPLGIDVRLKRFINKKAFLSTLKKMNYPDLIIYSIESNPSVPPNTWLHMAAIPSIDNSYMGQNYTAWRNERVSKLLDRYTSEVYKKKRLKHLEQLNVEIDKDKPGFVLFKYQKN